MRKNALVWSLLLRTDAQGAAVDSLAVYDRQ
jgi:hypothetical protein